MVHVRIALAAAGLLCIGGTARAQSIGPAPAVVSDRALRKEIVVAAPRAEVWKAWSTSEGLPTFLGQSAKVELRLGGPYEIYMSNDAPEGSRGSEGCVVLGFVPEEMLSFTWNAPPQFPEIRKQRTFVVLNFEDAGAGRTRVRLTHRGWGTGEEWDKVYTYFDGAWTWVMGSLEKRFAPKAGAPTQPAPKLEQWVYFIHPTRPEFIEKATPEEAKAVGAHFRYLKQLTEEGVVVLAGPSLQPPYTGIVIFEAKDRPAAQALMDGDPAVKAGVFKATLAPFRLSLLRKR